MRVILYTGKGGVGKTSLSAATAIEAARRGHRTIVLSTDAAHSLADALEIPLSGGPVEVAPGLFAEEVIVHRELKAHWGTIQAYVTRFLTSQGYESVIAEELAILPGMEELFALLKLKEYADQATYEVAVVDCAPTGATLKLLGFTDIVEWYMKRFFDLQRRIVRTIRPVAERVIKAPLPGDEVYGAVERLFRRILALRDLLTDPACTSIRLVTNPERMVIRESQRAYTYLNLFGYPVDLVVNNRVLPPEAKGGYLDGWLAAQKGYRREIDRAFRPIPVRTGPLFGAEVVGLERLAEMGRAVFGEDDPAAVFHRDRPVEIHQANGAYVLSIKLPGVKKDEIDLWAKEGELIVTVRDHQRNILLPSALQGLELDRAGYRDGRFEITFRAPA